MQLYRAMIADESLDKPKIGNKARELGIRIMGEYIDIELINGNIGPDDGGMSVSPNSLENLPAHRKKRDPVWRIDSQFLSQFSLKYYEDKPGKHGLIKPAVEMTLSDYQYALNQTQKYWQLEENKP